MSVVTKAMPDGKANSQLAKPPSDPEAPSLHLRIWKHDTCPGASAWDVLWLQLVWPGVSILCAENSEMDAGAARGHMLRDGGQWDPGVGGGTGAS